MKDSTLLLSSSQQLQMRRTSMLQFLFVLFHFVVLFASEHVVAFHASQNALIGISGRVHGQNSHQSNVIVPSKLQLQSDFVSDTGLYKPSSFLNRQWKHVSTRLQDDRIESDVKSQGGLLLNNSNNPRLESREREGEHNTDTQKFSYFRTSSSFMSLVLEKPLDFDQVLSRFFEPMTLAVVTTSAQVLQSSLTIYQTALATTLATISAIQVALKEFWWSVPLLLCLAPATFQVLCQKALTTPEFWKMTNMQYILHSPDAAMVIGCFLGSNIAYFLAGGFLLYRFPRRSFYPGLGWWTISAGLISTIFHTVQAVGDHTLAEGLCYVDHGIAGAAILYFWKVCGKPPATKTFWSITIAGLTALSLPLNPGYAWLHSTWHFLSAASAIIWAMEGKLRRQQRLFNRIRTINSQRRRIFPLK